MEQLAGKKIVLAGGGSGGHVTPLLAVGEALARGGAKLFWLGAGDIDSQRGAQELGSVYAAITTGKWRRYYAIENVLTPAAVLIGIYQARRILTRWQPDLVFAKGGYVSLPTVLAARLLNIPIIIHESDVVMGLANRMAARFAKKVCVSQPVVNYSTIDRNILVETGLPVRPDFLRPRRPVSKPSKRKTILITGGSQGGHSLNLVVREALPQLLPRFAIIHLTGLADYPDFESLRQPDYQVFGRVGHEMAGLMGTADLIISRASATTLAEIAALGRPAILVPLAADPSGHQAANARLWQKAGAALVIPQKQLTVQHLLTTISTIVDQPGRVRAMAEAAAQLARPLAVARIATVIGQVLEE